nr:leucine-rich repeat domain-containing protein [Lachnospiraceae bacterium]
MKKTVRKVIGILLCVTAVLLIFLPSSDSFATTIKGDYELDGYTIVRYTGDAQVLTIPSNVTDIGKDAFSECKTLTTVNIPDSIRTIGYNAFENCTNLTQVNIGNGVRKIGSAAFAGCKNLKNITIPDKTDSLGSGVFASCSSLSNVNFGSGNSSYVCNDGVIYSKDGKKLIEFLPGKTTTSFSIPTNVEEIGEFGFFGANNLTEVILSSNIKKIPEYAFSNCSALTDVQLPYGVESLLAFCFSDCKSLRRITIPDSVSYIDVNAFANSGNAALDFDNENVKPEAEGSVSDNKLPPGDKGSVSGNALNKDSAGNLTYTGDTELYKGSVLGMTTSGVPAPGETYGSTKLVGGYAFIGLPTYASGGRSISLPDEEAEDDVSGSNQDIEASQKTLNGLTVSGRVLAASDGSNEKVNIPDTVDTIGNRAFYRDKSLKEVNIPSSVNNIGDFAFSRTDITDIVIPESVSDIGYAAFYNCNSLANVSIPSSVSNIELGAFDGTSWLHNWKKDPEGEYLVVGDGILLAYKGSGSSTITIPDGVKTIGPQCFKDNTVISTVNLPQSLKKIGEEAFLGCRNITDIKLPDSLSVIEDRAFMSTGLNEVVIPISVNSIGIGAFDNTETNPLNTVVFLGNKLPSVTHKSTAERLSAESIRTLPFNGVKNALVSNNVDLSSSSILSSDQYGFRGQVFKIMDASVDPGLVTLERSLTEPDSKGNVVINTSLTAGGRNYILSGIKDNAFAPYSNVTDWSRYSLAKISVNGTESEDLTSLISKVPVTASNSSLPNGLVVKISGADLTNADKAIVNISNLNSSYVLNIIEDEVQSSVLKEAIASQGIKADDLNLIPLSISMEEKLTHIPIKKLATQKLELSIPLPDKFMGSMDVRMCTLTDNGLFETVPSEIIDVEGIKYLRFVVSHLSPFAIYKYAKGEFSNSVNLPKDGES